MSETHVFSNQLLNNLIVNYQREGSVRGPLPGSINVGALGVNIWQPSEVIQSICQRHWRLLARAKSIATFKRSNVTLTEDLHWVKGSHNMAFGFHGEMAKST